MLSVVPFLALARELGALLVPVQPRADFRTELERSLLAQARQQNAQARLVPVLVEGRDGLERRWVVVGAAAAAAAAVGSAVSIAGIVVYVRRRRDRAA